MIIIEGLVSRKWTASSRYYILLDNGYIYVVPQVVYDNNIVGTPFSKRLWV